ncbi:MAG: winged helix DNA-binding domain-containing protein [Candidatus Promineifilaceae bacterium]
MTRDALRDHLRQAGLDTSNLLRVTYIVMWAELEQIICSGPRQGKQFTYMLMDERVPAAAPLTYDEALTELSRRYFRSRGPATPADFAKWSGLTLSEARNGLEAVKNEFAQVEAGGQVYYLPSTSLPPTAAAPRAFLLSIYDEMISSYKDRSAIGEAEVGLKLLSMGNALTHIVLLEGQIVGTFRRELKTKQAVLELNLFRAVTPREDEAIVAAADQYSTFLQLPVHLIRTQP